MCGICGFYQTEGEADSILLKRMNDRITHRGPDDEGFHLEGNVAGCLAFPRLIPEQSDRRFYRVLRDHYGVLLLPGGLFAMDNRFFRIGFGRADFAAGLDRVQECLQKWTP